MKRIKYSERDAWAIIFAFIALLLIAAVFPYIAEAKDQIKPIDQLGKVILEAGTRPMPEKYLLYGEPVPTPTPSPVPSKVRPKPKTANKQTVQPTPKQAVRQPVAAGDIQTRMKAKVVAKWGDHEWAAMVYILDHESGGNPYAVNKSSGACGIPQALPCSKLLKVIGSLDNIDGQLDWMVSYIASRYGTPTKAMAFHKSHNWY